MRAVLAFVLFGVSLSDKASFQTNVNRIAEHLQQSTLTGEDYNIGLAMGNRLYAEHVLSSLAKLDPADSGIADTFTSIRAAFTTIRDLLTAAKTTAQAGLDAANINIAACPVAATHTNVATLISNFGAASSTLNTCHGAEDGTADTADSDCHNYLTFITTLTGSTPSHCVLPPHDFVSGNDMGAVNTFISGGKSWFNTHQSLFNTQSAACEASHVAFAAQNTQCRTDQQNYEGAICLAHNAAVSMCANEDTCYAAAVAAHNALWPTALVDANQRVSDGIAIHYVDCLVENLQNNADQDFAVWQAACAGIQTDVTIPPLYNNTFPVLDAQTVCDSEVNGGTIPDGASGSFGTTTYTAALSTNIFMNTVMSC
jgi:hypothetical protein